MSTINFFVEDIDFTLDHEKELTSWIAHVAQRYECTIEEVNFVFCSDAYLLALNQQHLDHDTLTDIITFPLHPRGAKELSGDIFISVERVKENAELFHVEHRDELHRVMIHGILHMAGEDDKDESSQIDMRKAEDFALSLREF